MTLWERFAIRAMVLAAGLVSLLCLAASALFFADGHAGLGLINLAAAGLDLLAARCGRCYLKEDENAE